MPLWRNESLSVVDPHSSGGSCDAGRSNRSGPWRPSRPTGRSRWPGRALLMLAPGEPGARRAAVVVAAGGSLREGLAAGKLGADRHDKRVFHQPAGLEVTQEGRDRPVDTLGHRRQLIGDVVVVVPVVRRAAGPAPDLYGKIALLAPGSRRGSKQRRPKSAVMGFSGPYRVRVASVSALELRASGFSATCGPPAQARRRFAIRAAGAPALPAAWRRFNRSRTARPSRLARAGVKEEAEDGGK